MNTAILMTCFNRREKTLNCLKQLYNQKFDFDVYLVDDGSTDGTAVEIKEKYPQVSILQGSGNLFWNGGMRLAWQSAVKNKKYDYFIWLNDDTNILDGGLLNLFNDFHSIENKQNNRLFILTAACKQKNINQFSYGGRNDKNIAICPNGVFQKCKYINGNLVLVSYEVFEKIGELSSRFTHAMGDFDYGLRAQKQGINCYTTSVYIGECDLNPLPIWKDPNISFKKRWKSMHSSKGLNAKEFLYFTKIHKGRLNQLFAFCKIYITVLFPKIYKKLKHT